VEARTPNEQYPDALHLAIHQPRINIAFGHICSGCNLPEYPWRYAFMSKYDMPNFLALAL
jgi:hypothetical protein